MDKFAAPIMVVLAIGAYFLVNQQFKNVQQAVRQQPQIAPVVLPQPVIPTMPKFQPIKPFNPFASSDDGPEPAEDDFTPTPFESANGFCKASFPGGKPRNVKVPFPVRVQCYRITKQVAVFEVNYYDSGWREGQTASTPRQWLKRVHALQIGGLNAREELHKEVMIDDAIPGIEFEALFLKGDKPQMWVGKTYLVGRDIITASVYGEAGVVALRGPEFLKSFMLTNKAIEAASAAK